MTLRNWTVGAISLALAGCASNIGSRTPILEPAQVGLVEEGYVVRVRGYLLFESHARQLWLSESARISNDISNCVTLVNTGVLRTLLARRTRSIVTIRGRAFHDVTTGYVDLGACNRVGLSVEHVE